MTTHTMTRLLGATLLTLTACGGGSGRESSSSSTSIGPTTNGSNSGTGTSDGTDSGSASATSGDKFDVAQGTSTGVGSGGTCQEVNDTAENKLQPADIIMVVDNSGSMDFEANFVQNNLNDFSNQIIQSGIDVHVVLISSYPNNGNGICINAPLGKPGGCLENPQDDNQPPLFTHIDKSVSSNSALQDILDTEPQWRDLIRVTASLHIIVMTDDDSDLSAGAFDSQLKALDPIYGKYTFHAIAAPEDPITACLQMTQCCGLAAAKGTVYQQLVQQTGGIFGNLCSQQFGPIFDEVSTAVVQNSGLACEWDIPDQQNFDKDKVNVEFEDGIGGVLDIGRVDDPAECAGVTDGWYYDDPNMPTKILLCPQTCTKVQGFDDAKINIKFGCPTKPAG